MNCPRAHQNLPLTDNKSSAHLSRARTARPSPQARLHSRWISHIAPKLTSSSAPKCPAQSSHCITPSQADLGGINSHKLMPSRQSPAAANSQFGLQITPKKPGSQPWELIPQPESAQLKTKLAAGPARKAADGFPKITQFPFCGAWCPFTYSHLKIVLPIWINEESWQKWKTLITPRTRKTKGDKILLKCSIGNNPMLAPREPAGWA